MSSLLKDDLASAGWVVERRLGAGALAVVVRAHERDRPQRVRALKVVALRHREAVERLEREVLTLKDLEHPALIGCEGLQRGDEHVWAVLHEVHGRCMKDVRITLEQGLGVAARIAEALTYAHEHGVAHRDLKPDNVLLCADGVRVIDFSAAWSSDAPPLTQASANAPATPRYAPPEWFGSDASSDPFQADVYALGVLLYEQLSGEEAFGGDWETLARAKLAGRGLDPGDAHSRALRALVLNMTQRRGERRPSMGEVAAELVRWKLTPTVHAADAAPTQAPTLGVLPAHLEVIREMGRGSTGVVFEARDTRLDRKVAVKMLHPDLAVDATRRARFEREGRTLARLAHPGIVEVYDVIADDRSAALVMALGEQGSAANLSLPLEPARAFRMGARIARALAHAHARGVVHRDIKPENILLDASGEPRLTDFGLAAVADDVRLTRTGEVLGTLAYMAPEQVRGEQAGPASDQHGLAAVVAEWMTGVAPHGSVAPGPTILHILSDPPVLDGIAEPARSVLHQALAKRPQDRYPDLALFADDLEALATGGPTRVAPPSPWARARRAMWARRLPLAGLAVVGVVLALAGLAVAPTVRAWQAQRAVDGRVAALARAVDGLDSEGDRVAGDALLLGFLDQDQNTSGRPAAAAWALIAARRHRHGLGDAEVLKAWAASYRHALESAQQGVALTGMAVALANQGAFERLDGALVALETLGPLPASLADVDRQSAIARRDIPDDASLAGFLRGTKTHLSGYRDTIDLELDGKPPREVVLMREEEANVHTGTLDMTYLRTIPWTNDDCPGNNGHVRPIDLDGVDLVPGKTRFADGKCGWAYKRFDGTQWNATALAGPGTLWAGTAWQHPVLGRLAVMGTASYPRMVLVSGDVDVAPKPLPGLVVSSDVQYLDSGDLDGDGVDELLVWENSWGAQDLSVYEATATGVRRVARRKLGLSRGTVSRSPTGVGVQSVLSGHRANEAFPDPAPLWNPNAGLFFSGIHLDSPLMWPSQRALYSFALDLDDDDIDEIVVALESGDLMIVRWQDGELVPRVLRDMQMGRHVDLDGDGDPELLVYLDEQEDLWVLGAGDTPLPRVARASPPVVPAGAEAGWTRAVWLDRLGFPTLAQALFEGEFHRGGAASAEAARRIARSLTRDRAGAAAWWAKAGQASDLDRAVQASPDALQTVDYARRAADLGSTPERVETLAQVLALVPTDAASEKLVHDGEVSPTVRVLRPEGVRLGTDGLSLVVVDDDVLLEAPVVLGEGTISLDAQFTTTHLEFTRTVLLEVVQGDDVVVQMSIVGRGASSAPSEGVCVRFSGIEQPLSKGFWMTDERRRFSVGARRPGKGDRVSSRIDVSDGATSYSFRCERLPGTMVPGPAVVRVRGARPKNGSYGDSRLVLHELVVGGVTTGPPHRPTVSDLLARGELHQARSLPSDPHTTVEQLGLARGTPDAQEALQRVIDDQGEDTLLRELRVGDVALAMRVAGDDRFVRFAEAWGSTVSTFPLDSFGRDVLIRHLHGLREATPRDDDEARALVTLLLARARARADSPSAKRDVGADTRRAFDIGATLPVDTRTPVVLAYSAVLVDEGDADGAMQVLADHHAAVPHDLVFLDTVRFSPRLKALSTHPDRARLLAPAGPWYDIADMPLPRFDAAGAR